MKPKLEARLFKRFSKLFAPDCMFIECGGGWYNLLWHVFIQLERTLSPDSHFAVRQVKEKFGLLRIYVFAGNEATGKLTHQAEADSRTICERCGKSGKLRKVWHMVATLCDDCDIRLQKRRKRL